MWTLTKQFTFEASHQLPHHGGKCARLHGHSWVLEVECRGPWLHPEGTQAGMMIDYGIISLHTKPLLEMYLDHWHLNDTTELENPTSEEVARWVYHLLESDLPGLHAVTIRETCTSACRYTPETRASHGQ